MAEQIAEEGVKTVLHKLREATAHMHTSLENTALSRSLLSPGITLDNYRKYLLAMEQVIAFTEQKVFPLLDGIIPDLEQRQKIKYINNDLSFLGKTLPNITLNSKYDASMTDQPKINFALGFMYVTEGSTLGGLYILKQLGPKLKLDETNGGSFFYGYGKDTGKRWNDFLTYMTEHINKNGNTDELVEGAMYAFSTIHHFFESIDA